MVPLMGFEFTFPSGLIFKNRSGEEQATEMPGNLRNAE